MSNPYYTKSSAPTTSSQSSSSAVRAEFSSIQSAFDKFPALTGYGYTSIKVNGAGTALTNGGFITEPVSFTPTFSFATPGDLSVSYASRAGIVSRFDGLTFVFIQMFWTPTFTTASGNAKISVPFTAAGTSDETYLGAVRFDSGNVTIAGTTLQVAPYITGGTTELLFSRVGDNIAAGFLDATNFTSGTQKIVTLSIIYRIA